MVILLMAIVSLIAWRGLDRASRADSHLQASPEQTVALLRTLNQLYRATSAASDRYPLPAPKKAVTVQRLDIPLETQIPRRTQGCLLQRAHLLEVSFPGDILQRSNQRHGADKLSVDA